MTPRRKLRQPTKKSSPAKKSVAERSASTQERRADELYADYRIWKEDSAPRWIAIKKMRYIFWRMMSGCTVTDAIAEIHWNAAEFWHHVDLKRNAPFRLEYKRAQVLQSRAMADQVVIVAEARDVISTGAKTEMVRLIKRAFRKSRGKAKHLPMVLDALTDQLSMARKDLIARNKLQMDGLKWKAKTANPAEFGEKQTLGIGAPPSGDTGAVSSKMEVVFITPAKGSKPKADAS